MEGMCACAGESALSDPMDWSTLPLDMVEAVLAALSLYELARVTATCRTVRAFYRRRFAAEPKARLDLATKVWGGDHIACVTDLIVKLLQGAPTDLELPDKRLKPRWITHRAGPNHNPASSETSVVISPPDLNAYDDLTIYVKVKNPAWARLKVYFPCNRNGVLLLVCPKSDDALEAIALVQAIMEGGLAQFIDVGEKWAQVLIQAQARGKVSRGGMKSQIAPLLALSSRYISTAERPFMIERFVESVCFG
jgi:hypothetical protein